MLKGVSWNKYIVVVVLLVIVWYLFVGLRYYFEEIKDVLTGRRKIQFRNLIGKTIPKSDCNFNYQKSDKILNSQNELETSDSVIDEVEDLVSKLKNAITNATQKEFLKNEFENDLQLILSGYPLLGDSPFRSSINELIVSECENQQSILLTYEEVDTLWD